MYHDGTKSAGKRHGNATKSELVYVKTSAAVKEKIKEHPGLAYEPAVATWHK